MPTGNSIGQNLPDGTTTTENLHKEFRSLITLTTLVTAINNKDRPTLKQPSELNLSPLATSQPARNIVLNAVATILEPDYQVIAAAAYDPPPPQPGLSVGPLHLVVIQGPQVNGKVALGESDSATQGEPDAKTDNEGVQDWNLDYRDVNKAIPDADTSANLYTTVPASSGSSRCTLVNRGTSHLSTQHLKDIWDQDSWDHYIKIGNNDPLSNHIATVENYLAMYKSLPPKDRMGCQLVFAKYLVARCWKRMHQRIIHWSSQNFIWQLSQVTEEDLRKVFSSYVTPPQSTAAPNRSNFALGSMLIGMERDGQIESFIMEPCGHPELRSEKLTKLVGAFREVISESGKIDLPPQKDWLGVYNETTCFEFHQLLIATLLAYGKGLDALKEVDGKTGKDLAPKYQQVWICSCLLWRIAFSKMLRHHLAILSKGDWLRLPINNQDMLTRCQLYTGFARQGGNGVVLQEENDDIGGEDDVVDQYERMSWYHANGAKLARVLLEWIRLQVSHWAALDFISATACSPTVPEGLKISLLAVEYPQLTHELEMEPWKTTVHNLFARLPVGSSSFNLNLNAEAVIETIAKHINEQEMPPSGNTIFRAFKDDTKPIKFDGNVHCEAILASLVKYVDTEKDPQIESVSLKVLIQNLNQSTIAMSHLCCPVCWELLDILRGGATNFNVRGRHATLYPVELPRWLPRDVMEQMVIRFKKILLIEITAMMSVAMATDDSDDSDGYW